MNMYTYICGRESNRFRNLDLREEGRNLNISGEEEIEKLFQVGTEVIKKFSSSIGQGAFPRVVMWAWHL